MPTQGPALWRYSTLILVLNHCALKLKNKLFPTVVVVDIPFYNEQFPTVIGKMDVHYNNRREKFTFLKIHRHDGTV